MPKDLICHLPQTLGTFSIFLAYFIHFLPYSSFSSSQSCLSHRHWDPNKWSTLKSGTLQSKGWKQKWVWPTQATHRGDNPSSTSKQMVIPTCWTLVPLPCQPGHFIPQAFTFQTSRYGDWGEVPGIGRIHTIYQQSKHLRVMSEHTPAFVICIHLHRHRFLSLPWRGSWEENEAYTGVSLFSQEQCWSCLI